jgi:hypothetical protein
MEWDQEENATKLTNKKEYDCVICNQTTPSSEDKPMGLVVLVQVIFYSLIFEMYLYLQRYFILIIFILSYV